jgi:phenylacetate-CoA ligase
MAEANSSQPATEAGQLGALRALLAEVVPKNPFYGRKLAAVGCSALPSSLADFTARFPFTTKAELVADQAANPPYGTNLTYPLTRYTRCHQTSGTTGTPLRWLDTPESWAAMTDDWVRVFRAAGVGPGDRILFAFSFGPFLGFWLAFEAGQKIGALCFAGGGMSSAVRLKLLLENECTVLCCTPTYALHLAEVAAQEKLDLSRSRVRTILVAGEAGGSVPGTRERLSKAWNGARVFDHHGMTETGPVTYEHPTQAGNLVVMEHSYFAEVVNPASGQPVPDGETGELVLTTLHRTGSPLIRYRTGDLVQSCPKSEVQSPKPTGVPILVTRHPSPVTLLQGGILGRVDEMVIVRGVNVYPTAIEQLVREFPAVAEYRVTHDTRGAMAELTVEVEADDATAAALGHRLHEALTLRIPVSAVPAGSLPRFELKAKRWARLA